MTFLDGEKLLQLILKKYLLLPTFSLEMDMNFSFLLSFGVLPAVANETDPFASISVRAWSPKVAEPMHSLFRRIPLLPNYICIFTGYSLYGDFSQLCPKLSGPLKKNHIRHSILISMRLYDACYNFPEGAHISDWFINLCLLQVLWYNVLS